MYQRSSGNPNICKAQAHNLIGEPLPSQAETENIEKHRPIGELFRIVLGASDGSFQGS